MVARDVTQMRQLEGARRNFFANVSHELRTPLTVLQGYLEMMSDEELDVILSTDSSEGRISLPLREIVGGQIRTGINRVMLVTGTGSSLVVRDAPAKSGKRLAAIPDGSKAHVIDGPQTADGITWWKLDSYNSKDPTAAGWSAGQFLKATTAP